MECKKPQHKASGGAVEASCTSGTGKLAWEDKANHGCQELEPLQAFACGKGQKLAEEEQARHFCL